MSMELSFSDLPMKAGTTLALRGADGVRIRSRCGKLWITTTGSTADTWIGDGEDATVSGSGLTVIEATTDAVVRLTSSAAADCGRPAPMPENLCTPMPEKLCTPMAEELCSIVGALRPATGAR